jgi:hypothetical protein
MLTCYACDVTVHTIASQERVRNMNARAADIAHDAGASTTTMSFADQGDAFDQRAGLPGSTAEDVAAAVVALGGLGPGELVVEVGAGSGEIGCHFVERVAYVGFDVTPSMLDAFRDRLGARAHAARLVVADGNAMWPVGDGSARVVFGSRSLHLLSLSHLVAEIDRVGAADGVTVLAGRVARDPSSVRMWMRRQMRRLLRELGIAGQRGGGEIARDLVAAHGASPSRHLATPIAPYVVARWPVAASPADSLAAWAGKDGLAGIAVDASTKRDVLERLQSQAAREFGDLEQRIETIEAYVLTGVRFSPRREHHEE